VRLRKTARRRSVSRLSRSRRPLVATTSLRSLENTETRLDYEAADWVWFTVAASAPADSDVLPLAEQLAVFSRPRGTADAVPSDALKLAKADGWKSGEYEGHELLQQSRLALSDAGSRRVDIYLLPTTKGFVCKYVVDPTDEFAGGPSGCDHALADRYTMEMSGTRNRLEVEGLVEDSVRRVEVEVWGRRIEADVGGNAYYLDMTLERSCPEAVSAIVLHSLGGARRIELDPFVPPPAAGTPRLPRCR
jgi:hypothetical protein